MIATGRRCANLRHLFVLVLLAILVTCFGLAAYSAPSQGKPGGSPPAPPTLPVAKHIQAWEFTTQAHRIFGAISDLGKHPSTARALRDSIPDRWEVGKSANEVPMAEFKTLLEAFDGQPKKRSELSEQLLARSNQLRELAAALSEKDSAAPQGQSARAQLGEILKRKEFKSVRQPNLFEQWKEKAALWLQRMLGRLFGKILNSPRAGRVTVWVLIGAIFIILAVWLGRRLSRSRLLGLNLEAPLPAGKSWRDWAWAALAAARVGRHREALHAAYWAGVYRLEELGAWRLDRTRTPREYLRLLLVRPPAAGPVASAPAFLATQAQRAALETLTRNFEVSWYGSHAAGEADFRNAIEQLEVLGCRF